jgi:hypothetical protein
MPANKRLSRAWPAPTNADADSRPKHFQIHIIHRRSLPHLLEIPSFLAADSPQPLVQFPLFAGKPFRCALKIICHFNDDLIPDCPNARHGLQIRSMPLV